MILHITHHVCGPDKGRCFTWDLSRTITIWSPNRGNCATTCAMAAFLSKLRHESRLAAVSENVQRDRPEADYLPEGYRWDDLEIAHWPEQVAVLPQPVGASGRALVRKAGAGGCSRTSTPPSPNRSSDRAGEQYGSLDWYNGAHASPAIPRRYVRRATAEERHETNRRTVLHPASADQNFHYSSAEAAAA